MLPDNKDIKLLRDFDNKVEMATFLESGKILVKIGNRFMVFDEYGVFIDEAEFKDLRELEH